MRTTCLVLLLVSSFAGTLPGAESLQIGDRLEPLVDQYLIQSLAGKAIRKQHRPEAREVVLVTGEPWEGNTCAYYTIFRDDKIFRMYYRGSHADERTQKSLHPEVTCYAESKDGIHWTKPNLGLYRFNGSKNNNIVWNGIGTHCFAPFKDPNPKAAADARYKALSRGKLNGKTGLFAFKSPDGIHWSLMRNEPVITLGAFDSQNLAFFDVHRGEYREYHRHFKDRKRVIMTGTSKDFINWTHPVFLNYPGAPKEHLYTNAIRSYPGAPQLVLGFPTRYQPKNSQVEPVFMTSRDRVTFERWPDAVIPITAPKDRDGNRSNYMTYGLLSLPGSPQEHSVFATEAYYAGPNTRVRRFAFRKDGFVSIQATGKGSMTTKPLTFKGQELVVNFKTKDRGQVRAAVLHDGKPIAGLSLSDCQPLRGDSISHAIKWSQGQKLKSMAGKTVQLQFEIVDADLYSLRFR